MAKGTQRHIYGEVNSLEDVRKINKEIRDEMDDVRKREELTELKKRADYLCTLAEAPPWEEKFKGRIDNVRRATRDEDAKTTDYANTVARKHGWDADYDPWG